MQYNDEKERVKKHMGQAPEILTFNTYVQKGSFRNIFDGAIWDKGLIFSLSFPQLQYSDQTVYMQRLV